jgi:hypothetical protein
VLELYSTSWLDDGYEDAQGLLSSQYLLGSYDIFEQEDLGLDRLFNES